MVSNVAKLTRSVRSGFGKAESQPQSSSTAISAEKRASVHQELQKTGEAIFVDDKGNRFRIQRRPA